MLELTVTLIDVDYTNAKMFLIVAHARCTRENSGELTRKRRKITRKQNGCFFHLLVSLRSSILITFRWRNDRFFSSPGEKLDTAEAEHFFSLSLAPVVNAVLDINNQQ
jgi:hypothetical protein